MKKPWYIWLSFIGFFGLLILTAKSVLLSKPFTMDKWIRLCGKFFALFFGVCLLPIAAMLMLQGVIANFNALAGEIFLFAVWIVAYLCGVYITCNLYKWKQLHT